MLKPIRPLTALSLGAALMAALPLTGCSGGSGGGVMFLEACSLGCSNGAGASQVFCSSDAIRLNQEIVLVFSDPVDINSVSPSTFQVVDVVTGATPGGGYLVDPANPRRLIFRPSMIVNPQGQLEFGFVQGQTYRIVVPGSDLDPGPYITSVDGKANRNRVRCDVQPSGIVDVVPGAPTVEVFVNQQLFDGMGNPAGIVPNVPADGAVDVSQDSPIRVVFNDVMNPLTVINAGSQTSPTVQVLVDRDGDPATTVDQTALAGSFSILIDQGQSKTRLTFQPNCIPSAGIDLRKIVVRFQPGIADLVGNPLANPDTIAFTPEVSTATALILPEPFGEFFVNRANLDGENSAKGMWAPDAEPGRLVPGFSGGTGRHGALRVAPGEVVVIDTDTQAYPAATFPSPGVEYNQVTNAVPGVDYDPLDRSTWPILPIDDGIIEFSSLNVSPGGILRLKGRNHARLFSRGRALVSGVIDVSGGSAPAQNASVPLTPGGVGGPNGGNGGNGGTRYNAPASLRTMTIVPPGIDLTAQNPPVTQALSGRDGEPVGLGTSPPDVPPPTDTYGRGGVHWPTAFPSGNQPSQYGGLRVDVVVCESKQAAGPGGGGGYALDGGAGVPRMIPFEACTDTGQPAGTDPMSLPPSNTTGGSATPIEPPDPESGHYVRKLVPDIGFLRGGAGGGGGGTNLTKTKTGGVPCPFGCGGQIGGFFDNSGGAGGGGGGALQITSGDDLLLSGQILAHGGDGGSAITDDPSSTGGFDRRNSTPGGGGAGGAVRLQGVTLQIASLPTRIDVRGGAGGLGVGGSTGGKGSRGLVRLESRDPAFPVTRDSEAPKVAPYDANDPQDSYQHLSAGPFATPRRRPEAMSAAMSCWSKANVADCFLQLDFAEDVVGSDDPADQGWNMLVIYDDGGGEHLFPYRGIPNDPDFPLLQSIQDTLGDHLAEGVTDPLASRLVVRFQGAQSKTEFLNDPCNVKLVGVDADVIAGSVTPWVSHPAELNQFLPAPNMIRFAIFFDGTLAIPNTLGAFIKGVTQLEIHAIPD